MTEISGQFQDNCTTSGISGLLKPLKHIYMAPYFTNKSEVHYIK